MIKAHAYLDGKLWGKPLLHHAPRKGDTVRLSDSKYALCTEVIWCWDEHIDSDWQRVNIRLEVMPSD